ncbi:tRNA lysidine(34) synthetase TilS [Muricoccus radiodurans]|uniref:tRNA lysidine(34) synthetase TilS n=1 Tax=Muricoccus radiodurans TaxID=2231721 RepID=UPI003CED87E7
MAPLGPFPPAPRLAAGVSGGPHSLAVALLARDWVAARGGTLVALIADHGLRTGSDAEAHDVAARLTALSIPARILPLGLSPGPALHERARAARLSALLAAAAAEGAPWLLLGHHRADQAETVAFRALRGSGPSGLAAMAPARPAPEALILRPLLDIPPARLEALVAGLHPVRDPSNDDPRFARARLRRALDDPEGTAPSTAALADAAAAFAVRRDRLRTAVADRLAACSTFHPEGWARLDRAALGEDDTAAVALAAILRSISGAAHPPPRAAVAALLRRGGGTLAGVLWRDTLLCREPAACAPSVPARPGVVWDGRWRVLSAPAGALIGALESGSSIPLAFRQLPAAVLATLPALRRDGLLLAVPPLDWPEPGLARLAFHPDSGAPA